MEKSFSVEWLKERRFPVVFHLDMICNEKSFHVEELSLTLGQVTILVKLFGKRVADIDWFVYVTIGNGKKSKD